MRRRLLRDDRGQASPEWLGVVLVVAVAFAAMAAAGLQVPGVGLARALTERLTCAVNLGIDVVSMSSTEARATDILRRRG